MSRIGQKAVAIPAGVTVACAERVLSVKGPKGALTLPIPDEFAVDVKPGQVGLRLAREDETLSARHGLYRSLIANMVTGVVKPYVKELEIQGVGFKAAAQGRKATFTLGFSAPKEMAIPDGIEVKITENVNIVISSSDKQAVGDFAARVKALYPAEPYKGKGIRFKGEYVRRKVGKTVA